MRREITSRASTFTDDNGNFRFNAQLEGMEELALEESHLVDDESLSTTVYLKGWWRWVIFRCTRHKRIIDN